MGTTRPVPREQVGSDERFPSRQRSTCTLTKGFFDEKKLDGSNDYSDFRSDIIGGR